MGLFGRLWHKKQALESVSVTLDLRDNGFMLNGVSFPFPARASELIKVLGEPRIAENQSMEYVRELYCKKYHFDPDTFCPWDYYWDSMGLFARTFDHETVHSLFIYLGKSSYPFPMPKCAFSGTLLIHGNPWQECILKKGGLSGAVPLGNLHLEVSLHGRDTDEKAVKVMALCLNHNVPLTFFDTESQGLNV